MLGIKTYVPVSAIFDADGTMIPTDLIWEDERKYHIDKVLDVRQVAAKSGGQGDRYAIRVNGRQSYLFFKRNVSFSGNNIRRWFVRGNMICRRCFNKNSPKAEAEGEISVFMDYSCLVILKPVTLYIWGRSLKPTS